MNKIKEYYWNYKNSNAGTMKELFDELYFLLKSASYQFAGSKKKTSLIFNVDASSFLNYLTSQCYNYMAEANVYVNGVTQYVGCLANTWDVWNDPFMSYDQLTMVRDEEYIVVYISEDITP